MIESVTSDPESVLGSCCRQREDRENLMDLCEPASREQDSKKLLALTAKIILLLNEEEDRLIH